MVLVEGACAVRHIPSDTLLHILELLSSREACTAALVCRRWHRVVSSLSWASRYAELWHTRDPRVSPTWQLAFSARMAQARSLDLRCTRTSMHGHSKDIKCVAVLASSQLVYTGEWVGGFVFAGWGQVWVAGLGGRSGWRFWVARPTCSRFLPRTMSHPSPPPQLLCTNCARLLRWDAHLLGPGDGHEGGAAAASRRHRPCREPGRGLAGERLQRRARQRLDAGRCGVRHPLQFGAASSGPGEARRTRV